jgi:hypothetical protein
VLFTDGARSRGNDATYQGNRGYARVHVPVHPILYDTYDPIRTLFRNTPIQRPTDLDPAPIVIGNGGNITVGAGTSVEYTRSKVFLMTWPNQPAAEFTKPAGILAGCVCFHQMRTTATNVGYYPEAARPRGTRTIRVALRANIDTRSRSTFTRIAP